MIKKTKNLSRMFNLLNKNENLLVSASLLICTLLIYIQNISNSVYGGDSGDFLAASATYGIPHPSGYPLYTLIGILFINFLPFGSTIAYKFSFFSSLISSLSVVLMYLTLKRITDNRFLSITSALTLAFAFPFWLYAEVVEITALHFFFIIQLIYLTVTYLETKTIKTLYWLAFFGGLSLTNNLSILLLFPGILVALLISNKKIILNAKNLIKFFILGLAGLLPYLYIPIAASSSPAINNGFAINLNNFIHLVTRQYYGWDNKTSLDTSVIDANFKFYLDYWLTYLNWGILVFVILGIIYLLKSKKTGLSWLLILSFLLFGPFFLFKGRVEFQNLGNVGILEKFYPQSIIFAVYFLPLGFISLNSALNKYIRNPLPKIMIFYAIYLMALVQPVTFFFKNSQKLDLNNIYLGNSIGEDVLTNVEKGSIMLLQDDSTIMSALYNQKVLGIRPDVHIPGLHDGFDIILRNIDLKGEDIENYKVRNKGNIDRELFSSTVPLLVEKYPVYTNLPVEIEGVNKRKIVSIPLGLVYKLEYEDNINLTNEEYQKKLEGFLRIYHYDDLLINNKIISDHLYLSHIRNAYSLGLNQVSAYLITKYKDNNQALKYIKEAMKLEE